ncbi:DUF6351 family protein [Ornithinimicrobium cryptoxanthini]|uniref:DUF6351 family protein n=1 Tax=Ornithinimicrobium cryptoxanthini TaxID=2934161 RepID=UPI0021180268|nr:DUF6351 family protein [Ornithinimicrobium cryptoxanthini]
MATGLRSRLVSLLGATALGLTMLASAPVAVGEEPLLAADPPVQYPFACTAQDHRLDPVVDNQDGVGTPVLDAGGSVIGYSKDCFAETKIWYYAVDTAGELHIVRDHEEAPVADIAAAMPVGTTLATTTLMDGTTVPYLIRHERGVLNRFIYSISMLATEDEVAQGGPEDGDDTLWNGRLLFQFQGGVGIGHTQGRYDERGPRARAVKGDPDRLGMGYAVMYSTGTITADHYNLLVGGRTAVMVKDHFVATHGEPDYTVGLGGSGGGIQQYVYAQNHPDLLDALVPQVPYPDMTTQTIHVGDCALLDRWMDLEAADGGHWADWEERKKLQGLNSIEGYLGDNAEALNGAKDLLQATLGVDLPRQTGSSECLEGWLGLLPLAMNPLYGSETNWGLLGDQVDQIERTHWDDAREAYGTDPETGYARSTWDNVGVQYGLRSVASGNMTPEQFLEVNAEVGGWKDTPDMVHEGVPFEDLNTVLGRIAQSRGLPAPGVLQGLATGAIPITELFDPWSLRNANLSPDGGVTPAPRTDGDLVAISNVYDSGLVFRGSLPREIPIIDARPYLEHVLDMHNSHQSFAVRQRLLDGQGRHDGQVIWFMGTDASGDGPEAQFTHEALDTIEEWMANLAADPSMTVTEAAPALAADRCVASDGTEIARGDGVWSGILDEGPEGPCTQSFELHTTSRIEAGGPITGDIYKCNVMPVETAVAEDLYGSWQPTRAQVSRLQEIFPEGVCDYGLPSQGDPTASVSAAPALVKITGKAMHVLATPGATVQLRLDGAVVSERKVNPKGKVTIPGVVSGTYTLRQVIDGQPGLLSTPIRVR